MRLEIPKELRARLHARIARAGPNEIGGVLMAEQLQAGSFALVDFTVDGRTGSAAHFVRSVEEHGEALEAFFARTGSDYSRFNYLGEWHSHPNHRPIPSVEDSLSMLELVQSERGIPFAVLLVARASRTRLAMSVTLFQQDAGPERVDLVVA